jgi:hypothetical protein
MTGTELPPKTAIRKLETSSVFAREIDRSLSIVVETAQNSNRANFPLKSKAKNLTARCSALDRHEKEIAI